MTVTIERPAATVASLSYGELSVALNASDMPGTHAPGVGLRQLSAWAQQGLDRLGADTVRRIDQRTRALASRYESGELTAAERAEYRRMWPSQRRRNTAISHAYHLTSALRPPYWLAWRRAHGLAPEPAL
jgi:hypothetical protein